LYTGFDLACANVVKSLAELVICGIYVLATLVCCSLQLLLVYYVCLQKNHNEQLNKWYSLPHKTDSWWESTTRFIHYAHRIIRKTFDFQEN